VKVLEVVLEVDRKAYIKNEGVKGYIRGWQMNINCKSVEGYVKGQQSWIWAMCIFVGKVQTFKNHGHNGKSFMSTSSMTIQKKSRSKKFYCCV
jgi:hypothetical protein